MAARRGAPRGAGRPAAGGLTLGQASGGRPAPVRAAPIKQGLGLGLGLNAQQRGNFTAAQQGGRGVDWMTSHPGVMQRLGQLNPTGQRAQNVQNFLGTGQSQRANLPRNMPRPPQGQQRGGQMLNRQGPQIRPMGGLLPQNHPLQPYMGQVNPGMQSVLASRGNQMPTPQGGWTGQDSGFGGAQIGFTGDNAGQQPGLAAQAGGAAPAGGSWSRGANGQMGYTPFSQQSMGGAIGNYGGGGGGGPYGSWNPTGMTGGYGGAGMQGGIQQPYTGGQQMGSYFGGGGMYGGGQLPQGSYRSGPSQGGGYLTGYGSGGGQSGTGAYGAGQPQPSPRSGGFI